MKTRTYISILGMALLLSLSACSPSGKFVSVDAATFAREIAQTDVQLIDVRSAEEFAQAHIPGAVNMDVNAADFDAQIATLNKKHKVALYCRSGRRSKLAAERVAKAGFQVVELNEGILSWQGATE